MSPSQQAKSTLVEYLKSEVKPQEWTKDRIAEIEEARKQRFFWRFSKNLQFLTRQENSTHLQ